MILRKAKHSDIPVISDFQVKMALETENLELNVNTVNKGVTHIFDNPETGFYFVCENNNKICASMLVLYEWSDWRNSKVAWLHSVYVIPEHRSKGIFGMMYKEIKEWVEADNNLSGIRLYVDKNNHNAKKVYEKIGMNSEHYVLYEWMKS